MALGELSILAGLQFLLCRMGDSNAHPAGLQWELEVMPGTRQVLRKHCLFLLLSNSISNVEIIVDAQTGVRDITEPMLPLPSLPQW